MLVQHIALVSETDELSASELARVCAALQTQVTRDLSPVWSIAATVDSFPSLEDVPAGYWPIIVTSYESGCQPGLGIDLDGQPFAQVHVSPYWSLDASRACLELLVNPFGTRTITAPAPRSDQGPVEFLVEVCGSCGDAAYAYAIHDVLVSDFCTPAFFEQAPPNPSERYSVNGTLRAAHQLLPGGRLVWYDPPSGSWWMRNHWADTPSDVCLGALGKGAGVMRDVFHRPRRLASTLLATDALRARNAEQSERSERSARLRALRLRSLVRTRDLEGEPGQLTIDVAPAPVPEATEPKPRSAPPPLPSAGRSAAASKPAPASAPGRAHRTRGSSVPPSLAEPKTSPKQRATPSAAPSPSTAPVAISVKPAPDDAGHGQRLLTAATLAIFSAGLVIVVIGLLRAPAPSQPRSAAALASSTPSIGSKPQATPSQPSAAVAALPTVVAAAQAPVPAAEAEVAPVLAKHEVVAARTKHPAAPVAQPVSDARPPAPAAPVAIAAPPAPQAAAPTAPVLKVTPAAVAASNLDQLIDTRR